MRVSTQKRVSGGLNHALSVLKVLGFVGGFCTKPFNDFIVLIWSHAFLLACILNSVFFKSSVPFSISSLILVSGSWPWMERSAFVAMLGELLCLYPPETNSKLWPAIGELWIWSGGWDLMSGWRFYWENLSWHTHHYWVYYCCATLSQEGQAVESGGDRELSLIHMTYPDIWNSSVIITSGIIIMGKFVCMLFKWEWYWENVWSWYFRPLHS